MAANDYEFLSHWRVNGTCQQVYHILIEGTRYPHWWPEVCLSVDETNPGGEYGIGKSGRLLTKGKLPYKLRWDMVVSEVRYPHGFTILASGDFVGRGIWEFRQDGSEVDIEFDWRLRAQKPLLRFLSFLLKPVFAANHRWAMARGEEGLKRELASRSPGSPTS